MFINLGSPKCIIPNGLSLKTRPSNIQSAAFFHPPYLAVKILANKSLGVSPPLLNSPLISLNHVISLIEGSIDKASISPRAFNGFINSCPSPWATISATSATLTSATLPLNTTGNLEPSAEYPILTCILIPGCNTTVSGVVCLNLILFSLSKYVWGENIESNTSLNP